MNCCTADKAFTALPTYPVVLQFKLDGQDVNLFAERMGGGGPPVKGLPKLDLNRVVSVQVAHVLVNEKRVIFQVHATQSIEIVKDLPLVSGPGWKLKSRYTGVVENST